MNKMDLKKEGNGPAASSRIEDFSMGPERLEKLEKIIIELTESEFWSPKTQAWLPLVKAYLSSGNYPEWTRKYSDKLYELEDWLNIPKSEATGIYRDIHKLKNTSGSELFVDMRYSKIREFCDTVCRFYISQRKRVIREVHSEGVYNDVMTQLLNRDTYRGLMCAVTLFRHRHDKDHKFAEDQVADMNRRLNTWTDEFIAEFKVVQQFLGDLSRRYTWYSDTVRDAVERAWRNALDIENHKATVEPRVLFSLSEDRAAGLMYYINTSPAGDGPDLTGTGVFDAMYQIFFNNVQSEDNAERAFYALCVPPSSFKTMVDYLYDFYWMVEDGILTGALYSRIVVAHQRNKDAEDPDYYLESLTYRGFPPLK